MLTISLKLVGSKPLTHITSCKGQAALSSEFDVVPVHLRETPLRIWVTFASHETFFVDETLSLEKFDSKVKKQFWQKLRCSNLLIIFLAPFLESG